MGFNKGLLLLGSETFCSVTRLSARVNLIYHNLKKFYAYLISQRVCEKGIFVNSVTKIIRLTYLNSALIAGRKN